MKVYVDKLPQSCSRCPCCQTDGCVSWCGIFEANDENNWHPGNEYDNSDFRNVKRLAICPLIVLKEIENE